MPSLARSPHWTLDREPFLLETSHPGVFAAGDVRLGSMKRVASTVGEEAMAVKFGTSTWPKSDPRPVPSLPIQREHRKAKPPHDGRESEGDDHGHPHE
jgi:hypothetical protein